MVMCILLLLLSVIIITDNNNNNMNSNNIMNSRSVELTVNNVAVMVVDLWDVCKSLQQDKLKAAVGFNEMCHEHRLIISVSDVTSCLCSVTCNFAVTLYHIVW